MQSWQSRVTLNSEMGFSSSGCGHSLSMDTGHRNLAEVRRHTYAYRLTFWHIINTFLLLAGGNLWENQISTVRTL